MIVAFDIDGMLTTEAGMTAFNRFKNRDDVTIGIITSRKEKGMDSFIQKNNIRPDFKVSTYLKGRAMRKMKDDGVYYGSRPLDRLMTKLSGWKYRTF